MKKRLIISSFLLSLVVSNSALSIEANVWVYKVNPGQMNTAVDLFEEAIKMAEEADRNTVIAQQSFGKGGEFIYHWVDFYDSLEQKANDPYQADDFADFNDKFYDSGAVSTVRSYSMTLIDDQLCSVNSVVSVYVWKPRPGKFSEVVESFKASQAFFEKHGWEIDLWQENIGGRDNLQFVMCSASLAAQANSFASLNSDEEWILEQPNAPLWDSDSDNSDLVASFELNPIILD